MRADGRPNRFIRELAKLRQDFPSNCGVGIRHPLREPGILGCGRLLFEPFRVPIQRIGPPSQPRTLAGRGSDQGVIEIIQSCQFALNLREFVQAGGNRGLACLFGVVFLVAGDRQVRK